MDNTTGGIMSLGGLWLYQRNLSSGDVYDRWFILLDFSVKSHYKSFKRNKAAFKSSWARVPCPLSPGLDPGLGYRGDGGVTVLVGLRKPEAILSQGDWAGFLCVRIDSHHLSLWEKVAQLWKETQSWFSLRGTLEWKVLTLGWNRWFASRECGRLMFLRF